MGGLFEALFSNIFVLVAIIAGLMSLFKKNDSNDEDGPIFQERPRRSTTSRETQKKPASVEVDTLSNTKSESSDDVQIDTSNKWYEQLEESRERREQSKTDKNLDKIKQRSIYKKDRTVSNISIRKNINNSKRLIESLVMSEVLGQPKAKRKRY